MIRDIVDRCILVIEKVSSLWLTLDAWKGQKASCIKLFRTIRRASLRIDGPNRPDSAGNRLLIS